eukprot:jgi/Psemu1/318676/estExt_fgenesh1_pm.C_1040019
MMEENTNDEPTDDHLSPLQRKDKNPSKTRRKKRRSHGHSRSNKTDSVDKESNPNAEKFSTNTGWEIDTITKTPRDSSSIGDSHDSQQEKETPGDLQLPSPTPTDRSSGQQSAGSSTKGKNRSRRKAEKVYLLNELNVENGGRTAPDDSNERSEDDYEKESNRNSRRSPKGGSRSKDSTEPSQRVSDKSKVVDNPPSKPQNRTHSTPQKGEEHSTIDRGDDKQSKKPKRNNRVSPKKNEEEHDDKLGLGSFHTLRIDSDKPKSRSSSSRRRNKTPTSGRASRRRQNDQTIDNSDDVLAEQNIDISNDASRITDVDMNNENILSREKVRAIRERRKGRERLSLNDGTRRSLSATSSDARRPHSERWEKVVENFAGDGIDDPESIKRRAHESLTRANDGLSRSRSGHTQIRRHHSGSLAGSRTYHAKESDRRSLNDGRRTPRRATRRHRRANSSESFADDSAHSMELESIHDVEDFVEDRYRMNLQTPGMIDFEEEMLDLMQRANPEVTEHLDRRVHRKREMVAFDHNMPMMTRQALLTRQASSQVQRQFFDGSNIDKKRLVLRNDSMSSTDGLTMSNHRMMRSAHGKRAPPRAKSSGYGGVGRMGYSDSFKSDLDDRRRVFRSKSSHGTQPASFNQYYQNKPNKARTLSRRASSDLIRPHSMRGSSRSSEAVGRRRALKRTTSPSSSTSRRRSASSDNLAPRMPERRHSKERSRRKSGGLHSPGGTGDAENLSDSFLKKKPLPKEKTKRYDKNDMSSKRNRSKLHLLMYKTKMCVSMDDLIRTVRQGETPRSPIHSLRMPSP